MAHDPHTHDRRDREVIVERGRGGPGAAIAAIVAVVLLALVVWFLFTNFLGGERSGSGSDSDVNVPEKIDVNVDEQGGGQGGQGGAP
ncbi:MAG: hypothetical protein M3N32_07220 [Actinomycetota bacterium]|nr:hypothetical protein [Actinomycetota bacterium]